MLIQELLKIKTYFWTKHEIEFFMDYATIKIEDPETPDKEVKMLVEKMSEFYEEESPNIVPESVL